MDRWNHLPYDILEIVLYHLEQINRISSCPSRFKRISSKNMFQCQLTCKNWTSLAKIYIYELIEIHSVKQLESFIYTLQNSNIGPLVKHIHLGQFFRKTIKRETLIFYIRQIATFCTFLKSLNMQSGDFRGIWNYISVERFKGNFSRLQAIPFLKDRTDGRVLEYNVAVFSVQKTLRELAVYSNNDSFDESKLCHFPNIDTVFFKLEDYFEIKIITRYMKWLLSITTVQVDFVCYWFPTARIDTKLVAHASTKVKRLFIKNIRYKDIVYGYLMEAFPNLQEINVTAITYCDIRIPASTNGTAQFLEYVLCIPKLQVSCIPLENQNDTMLRLHSKSRVITRLNIRYQKVSGYGAVSHLSIKTCTRVKEVLNIEVFYHIDTPPMLPCIGLIEQTENRLQYLEMNMGHEVSTRQGLDDGVTLSRILQQCPHLRGIYIRDTFLNIFGTRLQNSIGIRDYITLANSLINSSFLQTMSFYVSHVSQFTLKNNQFLDQVCCSIEEIYMPDTSFHHIVYSNNREVLRKVYLKLTKTRNSTTSYYLLYDDRSETCTENDYENSLSDQEILSLFIRCKDVDKVNIRLNKLDSIVKL